ncbi:DUF4013 domain-containing protein [Natrialbaceae archaeon A-CW3]
MRSLNDTFRYPTESEDWMRTMLIGGLLSFLGFLLIPLVFVYGYLVRVIRESREGSQDLPSFDDWGDLFVEGLQVFVIGLVFMLIPLVVAAVTIGGAVLAMLTGTDLGMVVGAGGLVLGLLLSMLLTLVFGYVAVAAIVNFALEETFSAAFDLQTLKSAMLHRDYAVAWILSVVVLIAGAVLGGLISEIPWIGSIIAAFVGFYAAMVAAVLWGDGFSDAMDEIDSIERPQVGESTA